MSQIGKILVPYMINFMNNIGIHPLIFGSFVYLVLGVGSLLFIKETYVENKNENC
jgi:TRAP-type C4-dicarboxylate transport system permease large subunit